MDVDGDVDSQLLQQFSSMATTDREVLIAEFQRLLGNRLSDAGCAFFLDMNNWQVIFFGKKKSTLAEFPPPNRAEIC